jgi:hypothetical protein
MVTSHGGSSFGWEAKCAVGHKVANKNPLIAIGDTTKIWPIGALVDVTSGAPRFARIAEDSSPNIAWK